MEFSGKLQKEDLYDLAVLLRPKHYWLSYVAEGWHGLALLAAIVWVTILGLLGRTNPSWLALGITWLVIAGIVIWTAYETRRDRARELQRLNAKLPEKLRLTSEGIRLVGPDSDEELLRWNDVSGWRERPRMFAIYGPSGGVVGAFSVAALPETERQRLRDFLQSQIPPFAAGRHRLTVE